MRDTAQINDLVTEVRSVASAVAAARLQLETMGPLSNRLASRSDAGSVEVVAADPPPPAEALPVRQSEKPQSEKRQSESPLSAFGRQSIQRNAGAKAQNT